MQHSKDKLSMLRIEIYTPWNKHKIVLWVPVYIDPKNRWIYLLQQQLALSLSWTFGMTMEKERERERERETYCGVHKNPFWDLMPTYSLGFRIHWASRLYPWLLGGISRVHPPSWISTFYKIMVEGSLEVKLPTIWRDEKQSREEAERRERLEGRRVEEKE